MSFNWKGEKYTRPDDYRRISLTFRTIANKQPEEKDEDSDKDENDARSNKKIKTWAWSLFKTLTPYSCKTSLTSIGSREAVFFGESSKMRNSLWDCFSQSADLAWKFYKFSGSSQNLEFSPAPRCAILPLFHRRSKSHKQQQTQQAQIPSISATKPSILEPVTV